MGEWADWENMREGATEEAARRARLNSVQCLPEVDCLFGDLMDMQVSTADPTKRMKLQDARDMAASLYLYDHRARSIRSVCYSMGDRTVITYWAADSLGGISREKMTFVYQQGEKA